MKRLRPRALLVPLVVLATAVVAWAFYATTGAGSGSGGTTGTMTAAAISVTSTSSGSHAVTFTQQAALSNSAFDNQIKYTVQRREGSGAFANVSSGGCSGQLDHGIASCTDTVATSGSYTYRVIARYSGWSATSADAGPVAVTVGAAVPAAPTSVALANGGGVGNAYINGSNAASVSVAVGLENSTAGDVVGVKIADADEQTIEQTALATGGATETVTVTGIDASALEDGPVTLRATSSNGSGSSSATTASVTKDTVKPTSEGGPLSNIASGNTFTAPYTATDASPSSTLEKVELYVDTPGTPRTFSLTNTDTTPSASGESFAYAGATADGSYRFYTRAYDKAGNAEDPPADYDRTGERTTTESTLRMATGTYTGTGGDNRAITDVGFQPDVVIVKGNTNQVAVMRTSSMTGDNTKPMSGATALDDNLVQDLTASGFQIGTDARVNANGVAYNWIAFQDGNGTVDVGSYTGTGSSQGITGVPFWPTYVAVLPAGGARAVQAFGSSGAFAFDTDAGTLTSRISSIDSDGFTVGTDAETNTAGALYHYVAFNDVPGSIHRGLYTGNTNSTRSITGVGFQPEYVAVRSGRMSAGQPREGNHRAASLVGTNSQQYDAGTNPSNQGIIGLEADGFRVNNSNFVNENGQPFHYLAFRNTGGGCGVPGTYTLGVKPVSEDTWVSQASPTSASGGLDSVLKVTSKSPNSNTRALVQFESLLPALPSGCTFTDGQLRLRNKSPVGGRTIEAYRVGAAWSANGANWNNQPGTVGTAATAVTPSSAGFMTWSVTSMLQAGASNGFLLRDQVENDSGGKEQQFDSSDASGTANDPHLVVTVGG